MNEIKSVTYRDDHGQDNTYTVGKYTCVKIIEHCSQGEGDKWFYDVVTSDGTIRLFDFSQVHFINPAP